MQVYIVHFIDAYEHIRGGVRLSSGADHDAINEAATLNYPYAMEVWTGDRLVWRFELPFSPRRAPEPSLST